MLQAGKRVRAHNMYSREFASVEQLLDLLRVWRLVCFAGWILDVDYLFLVAVSHSGFYLCIEIVAISLHVSLLQRITAVFQIDARQLLDLAVGVEHHPSLAVVELSPVPLLYFLGHF